MTTPTLVTTPTYLGMLGFSGALGLELGEGGAGRLWAEFDCGLAGPGLEGREGGAEDPLPLYEVGLGGAREESASSC